MTEALFIQFAALVASALLVPAFVFLAHGVNHRKMAFWWIAALAYLCMFLGSGLGALRGVVPDMVVFAAGNSLVGIGYFLCLKSVRMVKSDYRYSWLDKALIAGFFVSLYSILTWSNTYPHRVMVISVMIALTSLSVVLLASQPESRLSPLGDFALIIFGTGNTIIPTIRAISAVNDGSFRLINFAFWDQVFFVWSIAAVFCFSIGFFICGTALITKHTELKLAKEEQLTADLEKALESQRNLQKLLLHEVKRPINAIFSSVQASSSKNNGLTSRATGKLEALAHEAHRYLDGISQFDELASLIDEPDLSLISVTDVVEDVNRKWSVAVDGLANVKGSSVMADPLLLDIAIGNLIENARKFGITENEVKLTVGLDTNMVVFDVVDDGGGIPAPEQHKVFGQFYKVGSASRNAMQGCGLGLYVVDRIAVAHSGYAKVINQSPSTLRFALPRVMEVV